MKRIIATLSIVAVAALLAGCVTASGSSGTETVDLSNAETISALCGEEAAMVLTAIAPAIDAKPNSGLRNTLAKWGIDDPTDDEAVSSIQSALSERAAIEDCSLVVSDAADKMSDDERNAIIAALTVSTIPDSAVCKTDEYGNVAFAIDSLLGVPPRLWPDAISTKIEATDPVKARQELQVAICKDPNLGVAWLTFMATTVRDELKKATGIDIVALNPRLKEYTDVSQITPIATTFVPLLNVEKPTTAQVDNAVKQNAAWQQDAALLNTLLERFAVLGIDARKSVVNYHLTDYALDIDSLPTVGVNDKQEKLPALIFALTEKGQCRELVAFGANIGDRRPELFKAKGCETTTKPSAITPGTTTKSCPPGTTGTHPVCKDSHTRDPAQNGNADTGGGINDDSGSGTYVPPEESDEVPAVRGTPTPVTPTPVATADPAPTPDEEESTGPAGGCSAPPGKTC